MSLPTNFFIGRGGASESIWSSFTLYASIGPNSHSGDAANTYNGANLTTDSLNAADYYANYDTAANPWFLDPAVYSIYRAGFQKLTVPDTGTYRIRCYGTSGCISGNTGPSLITATNNFEGKGAIMQAEFNLTAGQDLYCVVAKQAEVEGTGGGATFVQLSPTGQPLIVAGGGGGNYGGQTGFCDTQDDTRGGAAISHPSLRATDGNGGDANVSNYGGGSGYYGGGVSGQRNGSRLRDNAQGSDYDATYKGVFGGGGGAISGGAGYSGGAGSGSPYGPGYGGSFISSLCTGQNVGNINGVAFTRTGNEPDSCFTGTAQLALGRNTLPYGKIEITKV